MNIITAKDTLTPEQFLRLPDADQYELVDGKLVERHRGWESSWVATQLLFFLTDYCRKNAAGWANGSEAIYQCFPQRPNKVRRPDASFIRHGRFENEQFPQGICTLAPDLAVEVISPNDTAYEIDEKVEEYLAAGVRLVWVVNPHTRTARVHRADGSVSQLHEADEMDGEDVLPGFRCRVGEFFPTPAGQGG